MLDDQQRPEVKGHIGHFGLEDWWFRELTEKEREIILRDLDLSDLDTTAREYLLESEVASTLRTLSGLLCSIADCLKSSGEKALGKKLAREAIELARKAGNVLEEHDAIRCLVKLHDYKGNEEVLTLWRRQVEIAPRVKAAMEEEGRSSMPIHSGYDGLVEHHWKKGREEKALRLARRAKEEGWTGVWKAWIRTLSED